MPTNLQSLQYEGKVLQDSYQLKDYSIIKNSSKILSSRLRGGAQGAKNSIGTFVSFKEIVQGKTSAIANLGQNNPGPYIVDQMEKAQPMEVNLSEVSSIFSVLHSISIICRLNGFWPKPKALF